jgi:hypothetical protein
VGSENVAKVFSNWPGVRHRAKVGLLWMASLAMDNANPPVFFGDRRDLAWAIGAPIRNEKAAEQAAKEVMKELRRDGAIVWSGQGRDGVRASYALALDFEHTWQPIGGGRNIKWQKVSRSEFPPGMQSKDTPGMVSALVGREPQGEEISPPEGEEISPPEGEEITTDRGRKSHPPTTSNFNSYSNQPIQSAPYVTREPPGASEKVDALDGNWSEEDERAHQLAGLRELQKKIDAEQKEAS